MNLIPGTFIVGGASRGEALFDQLYNRRETRLLRGDL